MRKERGQSPSPLAGEKVVYRVDPDDYGYGNLPRYLGSIHSTIGFLLFALGCAALLAFGVLAIQSGVTNEKNDLGKAVWFIPLWGIFAVPIGLSMRRKRPPVLSLLLGCALLVVSLALNAIFG